MKYLFSVLALVLLYSCQSPQADAKKPNILFVVVDDQGYSDFTPFNVNDYKNT